MPVPCCGTSCCCSRRAPTSPPTIWHSSARASGRSSPRARSAGSGSTSGRAGGISRRRAAVGGVPEVPRDGHNALASGCQGAQGQHAHHRRHLRAAGAHDPQSDRGIDRPRARRADESRVDRPMAHASRIERREVRQERGGRGNPVRERTDHRRRRLPTRRAHRGARRPLRGRAARSRTWPPW